MPELPDIMVYIEALERRIQGKTLQRVTVTSPFLLRTAEPSITAVVGRKVIHLRRLGKRICVELQGDLWLVLHLMIAGRLHWHEAGNNSSRSPGTSKPSKNPRGRGLATFQFDNGTLSLTEAGSQKRASLHLVKGESGLQRLNPGGLEIFGTDLETFTTVLHSANHTLKRALSDPRIFSGIGNAYSDEILFNARLSPVALTQKLTLAECDRLFESTRATLSEWVTRLREEAGDGFPEKVTAFRSGMSVHGKYHEPCPRCGNKIQRIRYASNETNYCPNCQTGGKLLADRALSRLLRIDWPRSAEELEALTLRD